MALFNDFIRESELVDVPLKNRLFTWSNKQPIPSHSRIDRVLVSSEISLNFPVIALHGLEVLVSDHAPLLLTCNSGPSRRRLYKMELFWLSNPKANDIIKASW